MTVKDLKEQLETLRDDEIVTNLDLAIQTNNPQEKAIFQAPFKVFKIRLKNSINWTFDTFDGCIMLAKNKEQVIEEYNKRSWDYLTDGETFRWDYDIDDYDITEIDLKQYLKPIVVLSSYCGG